MKNRCFTGRKRWLSMLSGVLVLFFCFFLWTQAASDGTATGEKPSVSHGALSLLESGSHTRLEKILSKDAESSESSPGADSSGAAEEESSSVEPTGEKMLTLSFVGDCMLASLYGQTHWDSLGGAMNREDPTFFFRHVASYFQSDDWTLANCENVFTDRDLLPVEKGYTPAYWYRSAAKNAGIFAVAGIDAVSVCNNHSGDYGAQGYQDTVQALYRAGVDVGASGKPLYFEKYGFRIGVICANLYGSGQTDAILKQVKEQKKLCDYVIVYFHGGTERIHTVEDWKKTACHRIADAGADLILGSHPHVLQPIEEYGDCVIAYSLGNFLFGGGRDQENRTIIFRLTLHLTDGVLTASSYEAIPCYVYATKDQSSAECWVPKPMEDEEQIRRVLAFLRGETDSPL